MTNQKYSNSKRHHPPTLPSSRKLSVLIFEALLIATCIIFNTMQHDYFNFTSITIINMHEMFKFFIFFSLARHQHFMFFFFANVYNIALFQISFRLLDFYEFFIFCEKWRKKNVISDAKILKNEMFSGWWIVFWIDEAFENFDLIFFRH